MDNSKIAFKVRILSVLLFFIGSFALLGSVFTWGEGFILLFPKGVDFSSPIADILVNAPACFVSSFGLWKMKKYGYAASQFFSGLAIYASIEIFVKSAQGDLPQAPEIIVPQVFAVVLSFILIFYLWKIREEFK